MPNTHRHSGPDRSDLADGAPRDNRRGALAVACAGRRDAGAPREQRHGRSRAPSAGSPAGLPYATQCVLYAVLALVAVLATEIVSMANREPAQPILNLIAGAFVAAALGMGAYAQITQLRRWSRRVRSRILVGVTLAACAALAVLSNAREKHAPPPDTDAVPAAAAAAASKSVAEDDAQPKPGWYGEAHTGGVVVVVTSFATDSAEARRFNRALQRPVTYAALSLINAGSPAPVVLAQLQASLLLDTGETVPSFGIPELLSRGAGQNEAVRSRLVEPQAVAFGAMIPDLPVCTEANFSWAHVTAVNIQLRSGTVTVSGRLMTAQEKLDLLGNTRTQASPDPQSRAAESLYKDL